VGNPEGKRPLGRPRRRWEDNNIIDLRVIEWDDMDWIELAQDRDQWGALVNTVMNLHVPQNATLLSYFCLNLQFIMIKCEFFMSLTKTVFFGEFLK
jgi:hypothetical protein